MKKVTVVMSTYNGGERIIKQLDYIFYQKGVEVECFIRDDGSRDKLTRKILADYMQKEFRLKVEFAENVGWQRSFLLALSKAPAANYYAFSDQDDVWMPEKLKKSVDELEKHNSQKALLFHCNRISCTPDLKALPVQAPKVPHPLNKKNALTQEYAQGCSIVINETARKLVCMHLPPVFVPHDFWTGLICYYFGEVYYSSEPLFYHINHGGNVSTAGHIYKGRIHRLKSFLRPDCYPNISKDLLEGYSDLLDVESKRFLKLACSYKNSLSKKMQLLFDSDFRRVNTPGTVLLKFAVLLGRY